MKAACGQMLSNMQLLSHRPSSGVPLIRPPIASRCRHILECIGTEHDEQRCGKLFIKILPGCADEYNHGLPLFSNGDNALPSADVTADQKRADETGRFCQYR